MKLFGPQNFSRARSVVRTTLRSSGAVACFAILIGGLAAGALTELVNGVTSAHAADAKNGKAVFEKCAACHSLEVNKNDDAPTLAGIFGRKAASEDFRYSNAMKQSNVTWDEHTLDAFLADPQGFIPGNRMPFDGLKEKADRDDLLEYLKEATKN
jgi:cytochrome c2